MLAILLTAVTGFAQNEELPVLQLGQKIGGEITDADPVVHAPALDEKYSGGLNRGKKFWIDIDETGPYYIELRSYFFDSYLMLRDAEGNLLGEEDDGPLPPHSLLRFRKLPLGRYLIDACSVGGDEGAFELVIRSGRPDRLRRTERAEARLRDARARADTLERHDPNSLRLGAALIELANQEAEGKQFDAAIASLKQAAAILRSLGPAGDVMLVDCLTDLIALDALSERIDAPSWNQLADEALRISSRLPAMEDALAARQLYGCSKHPARRR